MTGRLHAREYLRLIEKANKEGEVASGILAKEKLEVKLKEVEERLEKYHSYRELTEKERLTQISLTDADTPLMKNKNGMDVSHFLLKGKQKIDRKFAYMSMEFNLPRACKMFTFEELMALVAALWESDNRKVYFIQFLRSGNYKWTNKV